VKFLSVLEMKSTTLKQTTPIATLGRISLPVKRERVIPAVVGLPKRVSRLTTMTSLRIRAL
jgi:hypothetical protein